MTTQEVQDKPTEVGIKLNNVLTFMVLSMLSWVGYNIETMKDGQAEQNKILAVQINEISHVKDQVDKHINNRNIHRGQQ